MKAVSWENPVFENMDKLMEERYVPRTTLFV